MNHFLIEPATETILAQKAEAIRALGKRMIGDIIEIGRLLTEAKQIVGHGNWLPWIEREFGWSRQTANNFINVFKFEEFGKVPNFGNLSLPVSGLYMLAAPGTPDEAREALIARAEGGERLSFKAVAIQIDEARKKQATETADRQPTRKPAAKKRRDIDVRKRSEFDDNIDPKDLAGTLERALEAANAFSNWSKRESIPERRKKRSPNRSKPCGRWSRSFSGSFGGSREDRRS
ncbi:DUF3102 domain-containing protein [Bradyrhizobium septentrionale]|uniref:DUF3102 domain-containing protein n=1 Tax=Bradyrhizobium septentrionale TaxID=1404411 RepID=UPI001596ED3F|nr:DUF3102 domain-containing protein [Bradyrhizobium septentrionale]UGY28178.1 DUF3102 domain-containing protein [Bradyrhizobium septentrionale]